LEEEGLGKGKALGNTFILEKGTCLFGLILNINSVSQKSLTAPLKAPKPLVNCVSTGASYFQLIY